MAAGSGDDSIAAAARRWHPEAQLTRLQAEIIGGLILMRASRANLLIFGYGRDTEYWATLNHAGRTLVVEDDPEWLAEAGRSGGGFTLVEHAYPTTVGATAGLDLACHEATLDRHALPRGVAAHDWDLVIIDGPAGYDDAKPGRALPIHWAGRRIAQAAHVFVDDCERPLERRYCRHYLVGAGRGVVLPSHGQARMFWRFGRFAPLWG
ncbi:MAG: hypothetical protein IT561_25630 [Alphaproteobacteria bacterium]|nr:hypothetical protein [Alphaproteobacteria bacterium]